MPSTFFGLNIAYSGLQSAQTSINVTAHNISNINTSGYTRQAAQTQAADALRTYSSYGTLGSGVLVTDISQTRDSYYDVKYRNNQTNYGQYNTMNSYMSQIEGYLNEYGLKGYTVEYQTFFENVGQMTRTPSDASSKNQLINSASSMAGYFNTLAANLSNIQIDTNNEIKDAVQNINTLAKGIAQLNFQINQIETNYGNANDLRDKRNSLIDDLSKIANINVNEQKISDNTTQLSITIDGQNLVSDYTVNKLQVVAREEKRNASDAEGLYDIQWENGQNFDIYSPSLSGNLKALIDVRDGCNGEIESYAKDATDHYILDSDGNKTFAASDPDIKNTDYKGVPYYLSQLNQFVQTFTSTVNDLLKSGYTQDGNAGISLFTTKSGTDFMGAASVTANPELLADSNKLAFKAEAHAGVADCKIMTQLNDMQNKKIFDGGTGSYFLETIMNDMSIDAAQAKNMETNYKNISNTIQNQRLSIMGVDTDEEAMGLMKYQQAYNLNSKIMSVMNQIYDKLINQTGV